LRPWSVPLDAELEQLAVYPLAGRWQELGLPGRIPAVRAFETDSKVVYHEVGGFEPGKHQP
jgi:hypothetical protein